MPDSKQKRLVVLTGARQTGKTTLVKTIYPELKYINLDAPENREAIKNTGSASWAGNIGNAVLDEAQKEPSLFEKVKYAFDGGKITFSALLGSAQILLLEKVRESLAGRVFLYELWPLMVSEVLSTGPTNSPPAPLLEIILNSPAIDAACQAAPSILLAEEENRIIEAENYLLKWGGMPGLLALRDEDRGKWLESYEYTYLERDLGDLARLKDLEPFRKFQRLAALRSSQLLNYSELAKDSGLSADTSRRYLEYLTLSYQAILLQPYYENLTSSSIKSPKLYFCDIGILRRLAGLTGEPNGAVFETYAVAEIFKWIKTNQKNVEIYFLRTRSGLEVDLLLKTDRGIIGLEIKSAKKLSSADYRPMLQVAESLGKKWLGGICVYRGNQIIKLADPSIWAIPSFRLFS